MSVFNGRPKESDAADNLRLQRGRVQQLSGAHRHGDSYPATQPRRVRQQRILTPLVTY